MKRILPIFLGSLAATLAGAQSTDWTPVNLSVTDNVVMPGYERFEIAAASLVPAARQLCTVPDVQSLATMQDSFHQSMDKWQGIQHVQFGPITYFNWNFRLQFWPDDNNTGARQLTTLLASSDDSVLEAETFSRQSVGVQGFPALERLLFEDDSMQLLQNDAYRCRLVETISANLAEIAEGVNMRWREEFRGTVATADERGFFESADDATIDFLKALVESVRRIQQQKLESVLGDDAASSRVRRAESWRSARSLRNIRLNVSALHDLFSAGATPLNSVFVPDDVPVIESAFTELESGLAGLPDSMEEALASTEGFAALLQLRADLDALFEALEAALKNTDLYLGFNSLDGD